MASPSASEESQRELAWGLTRTRRNQAIALFIDLFPEQRDAETFIASCLRHPALVPSPRPDDPHGYWSRGLDKIEETLSAEQLVRRLKSAPIASSGSGELQRARIIRILTGEVFPPTAGMRWRLYARTAGPWLLPLATLLFIAGLVFQVGFRGPVRLTQASDVFLAMQCWERQWQGDDCLADNFGYWSPGYLDDHINFLLAAGVVASGHSERSDWHEALSGAWSTPDHLSPATRLGILVEARNLSLTEGVERESATDEEDKLNRADLQRELVVSLTALTGWMNSREELLLAQTFADAYAQPERGGEEPDGLDLLRAELNARSASLGFSLGGEIE